MQYVVGNYKKWLDLALLIRKLEDVDLSSKELISTTVTRTRAPTKIVKKRYKLELKKLR